MIMFRRPHWDDLVVSVSASHLVGHGFMPTGLYQRQGCHWSGKSQGNSRSGKSQGILEFVREI